MHGIPTTLSLGLLVIGCTGSGNGASSTNAPGAGGATSTIGGTGGKAEDGAAGDDAAGDDAAGDDTAGDGAAQGGAPNTVGADGATEGGALGCGSIANTASIVSKIANPAAQPAMTGGPLRDGTYEKTSIIDYETNSPGTTRHQETWRISGSGSVFQTVQKDPAEMIEKRFGATITTSDGSMTLNLNCPATKIISAKYTATANEIRFSSTANEVHVYTRVGSSTGGAGSGGAGAGGTGNCDAGGAFGGSAGTGGSGDPSLAVSQGTLFVGNGFRYISSCALGSTCALTPSTTWARRPTRVRSGSRTAASTGFPSRAAHDGSRSVPSPAAARDTRSSFIKEACSMACR